MKNKEDIRINIENDFLNIMKDLKKLNLDFFNFLEKKL
jgi:histone deacetylase complex regulatory component SIN3